MLVNWKGSGPTTVPLIHTEATKHINVARPSFMLWPGMNEIPDNEWEVGKVHIDSPYLEVVELKRKDGRKTPATKITDLELKDALTMVNQAVGMDPLYRWFQEDSREAVRAAIIVACTKKKFPNPATSNLEPLTDIEIPPLPTMKDE